MVQYLNTLRVYFLNMISHDIPALCPCYTSGIYTSYQISLCYTTCFHVLYQLFLHAIPTVVHKSSASMLSWACYTICLYMLYHLSPHTIPSVSPCYTSCLYMLYQLYICYNNGLNAIAAVPPCYCSCLPMFFQLCPHTIPAVFPCYSSCFHIFTVSMLNACFSFSIQAPFYFNIFLFLKRFFIYHFFR